MENVLFAECARLARGGGAGALASVARRRGSLPMSRTAKMLVTVTGARVGTIGGGCLEADITERALDVAERRACALETRTLNTEIAGDYGLTCGGTVTVGIEPVYPDAALAALYDACVATLARGERAVLATDLSSGHAKLLLRAEGCVFTFGDAGHLFEVAHAFDDRAEEPVLSGDLLVEPLVGAPQLVVIGGGHVGAAIAEAAAFAGWRATVVDDRPEFADAAQLPFAERAIVCDFHDLGDALSLDERSYVVVATRGHQHDVLVMDQMARQPLRYLGLLGSRRKVALTWKLLREWGVTEEMLARVHAPVGLALGADDPREIAISVVAEMIAVRRKVGRIEWKSLQPERTCLDYPTSTSSAR